MGRNRRYWRKWSLGAGQNLTEYTLILALVGMVVFTSYLAVGNHVHGVASEVDTFLNTAFSAF